MGRKKKQANKPQKKSDPYSKFSDLDGQHTWKEVDGDGHVDYPARELRQGTVTYFNFHLAKEMGLIPQNHPHKMNAQLKSKLISAFSIRIINEFDQKHNITYHPRLVKEHTYMATRYLQLQHQNKLGETSGDGRCIWNGMVRNGKDVWDVSSRGTGVTALAPGSVLAEEPLETGNIDHGYGCGLAEIDELYSSAIMSEIFYNQGFSTERMLAIVDFQDGYGIGVRAAKNLFRPAHLFRFLKQGKHKDLKSATDYLIDRQCQNSEWSFNPKSRKRYQYMLNELIESYTDMLVRLDREYVFMWLDWDGDNVLLDGGIIDYGSIRQFGLRHDQYRYDDVERFSTNLNEQYAKGQLIIQVFLQMVDYIEAGKKKSLRSFQNHKLIKEMKKRYDQKIVSYTLQQAGFSKKTADHFMQQHSDLAQLFYKAARTIEGLKTHKKIQRVDDGINRPALIRLHDLIEVIANHYEKHGLDSPSLEAQYLFECSLSEAASGKDRKMRTSMAKHFNRIEDLYHQLLCIERDRVGKKFKLKEISRTLKAQNSIPTLTGNGLIHLVDELLEKRKSGASDREMQTLIDFLIDSQSPINCLQGPIRLSKSTKKALLSLIVDNKHSI